MTRKEWMCSVIALLSELGKDKSNKHCKIASELIKEDCALKKKTAQKRKSSSKVKLLNMTKPKIDTTNIETESLNRVKELLVEAGNIIDSRTKDA